LLVVGVGWMALLRAGARERETAIDAAIITCTAGVFAWVYLIAPAAVDGAVPLYARIIAGSYPVANLLMVAMLSRLFFSVGRRVPSFAFLALGYFSLLVACLLDHIGRFAELGALASPAVTFYGLLYAFAPAGLAHPS